MILNIVFGVILLIFIIWGLARGLVRSIFGLLGIIVGIIVASEFYSKFFITHMHWEYAKMLSFIVLFIITYGVIYLIGRLLSAVLNSLKLSFIDHLLGGVVGLLRGSIIVWIVCFVVMLLPNGNEKIMHSRVSLLVLKEFKWLETYLPKDIRDKVKLEKPKEEINFLKYQMKTVSETERARTGAKSISKRQRAMDSAYQEVK